MARLDETIIDFVRRNGPSTPLEIAMRLKSDSIIVTAVLIDAVSQQKINQSKRRVGSMKYYYYPGHEEALQKRISTTLTPQDKVLLEKLMKENSIGEFEVQQTESAMLSNLEDLIRGFTIDYQGRPVKCWTVPKFDINKAKEIAENKLLKKLGVANAEVQKTAPTGEAPKEIPKEIPKIIAPTAIQKELPKVVPAEMPKTIPTTIPKVEIQKKVAVEPLKKEPEKAPATEKVVKPAAKPKEEKKKAEKEKDKIRQEVLAEMEGPFKENVMHWLEKQEIDVEEERVVKDKKDVEMEVRVPTPLGKQTYIVRVLDYGKKPINQSVLSGIGMDAIGKRVPAIVISKTGFAKSAKKYWEKELKDLVILVSKDDLE